MPARSALQIAKKKKLCIGSSTFVAKFLFVAEFHNLLNFTETREISTFAALTSRIKGFF